MKNSKGAIKLILDVFGTNAVWYDNNIPCFFIWEIYLTL